MDIRAFIKQKRWKIVYGISVVLIPAAIVGVFAMCGMVVSRNMHDMKNNESISGGFDSFSMYDFAGNEYTEDMFNQHRITMINVWGTFCRPCINEMPQLQEISEEYDQSDILIVGLTGDLYVNGILDENQVNLAKDIVTQIGVQYPILVPSIEIQSGVIDGNIQAFPTTFFYNSEGKLIDIVVGAMPKEKWDAKIEELLAYEK